MPAVETTPHVRRAADGVAWIDDSNVKVVEIVTDWLAHNSSPEEMHFQYPHLSLAQIHSALAYYYDHRAELDAEIERRLAMIESQRGTAGPQPVRKELVARLARR